MPKDSYIFLWKHLFHFEDPRIPQILSQRPNVANRQQDVNKKSWVQTGNVASLQQDVTEMALKTQGEAGRDFTHKKSVIGRVSVGGTSKNNSRPPGPSWHNSSLNKLRRFVFLYFPELQIED